MYEKIFTYGTLKNPKIIRKILGRLPKKRLFILKGFSLTKIKDGKESYPAIKKNPKGRILGIIYLVKKNELFLLDLYEGNAYIREKISHNETSFFVYFPKNSEDK